LAAEILDLTFDYPNETDMKRQAYRVHYPGLAIRVHGRKAPYPVIDLSPLGLAFTDKEQSFTLGQTMRLDLCIQDKVCVQGIQARIVRIRDMLRVACVFEELSRLQERLLDKLTLEIQKRLIEQRKRKQQEGHAQKPSET
jgi:hypothetical protein